MERLLAEEWPDGLFGGPLRRYTPRHDPAAAQHLADLAAALAGTEWHQPIPNPIRKATP
ncbi:hypothetical protein [Streptomyces sp. WM6349]|uniref:hypothetical protein n=1 Tax=Streptomyces sp. WM6349 TaxID=1415552 RepID=UPI00131E8690|nr:hypothetical protein [Streptomyces sp. WM6349]